MSSKIIKVNGRKIRVFDKEVKKSEPIKEVEKKPIKEVKKKATVKDAEKSDN